ncbi:hypothetical protein ACFQ4H_04190 [Micromonospora sonneratiae]|uniref:Secreted protein n=1 Tax=Micromonospora sonneratiae TaxID=1184706 RepID=A0ABW3Y782_9ACTN
MVTPTPNRMLLIGLGLTLLFGVTAIVGGLAAQAAADAGRDSVTSAARMSGNAQALYRSLAEADAAATGRFLAPPDSSQRGELEDRYQQALSEVRRLLGESAGYVGADPDRSAGLARIANQLPVYVGLIEKAQHLARDPRAEPKNALLGAAYLRQASGYLRSILLPAAERLWDEETARLREARQDGQLALFASIGVPVLVIGALWWSQRYLRTRTKRRISLGLVLATAAMLGTVGWLVASWRHWPQANQRLSVTGPKMDEHWELIRVQRSALQARSDDHLRLGGNSNEFGLEDLQKRFEDNAGCTDLDNPDTAPMSGLITAWCTAQKADIHQKELVGEHAAAIAAALPQGSVATAFERYDAELTRKIDEREEIIFRELARTPHAPDSMGSVVLVLCLIATAGVTVGIWVRVREYQ